MPKSAPYSSHWHPRSSFGYHARSSSRRHAAEKLLTGLYKGYFKKEVEERRGFTLLEVLVSLAIIAFALTAILKTQFYNLRTCSESKNILIVRMLAQKKMAEIELFGNLHPHLLPPPSRGRTEEREKNFSYTVRFDEIEKNLREINLKIIYKEGNLMKDFSVSTYLLTTDKHG